MTNVEVNVGPQINCADAVESIEINDTTNLIICNCSKASIITKSRFKKTFCCNFRGTSLYVSPSVLVSEVSWTFSSGNVPVAPLAMLLF